MELTLVDAVLPPSPSTHIAISATAGLSQRLRDTAAKVCADRAAEAKDAPSDDAVPPADPSIFHAPRTIAISAAVVIEFPAAFAHPASIAL